MSQLGNCTVCGRVAVGDECITCLKNERDRLQKAAEQLRNIHAIVEHAGLIHGPNAADGEEGGIVSVLVGSFAEAEKLHDLLIPEAWPNPFRAVEVAEKTPDETQQNTDTLSIRE